MLIKSEPRCPADRARLGDHAVARNHADRSQPLLNEVMDTRFGPVHRNWKALWTSQVKAEQETERRKLERDAADAALTRICEELARELTRRQGSGAGRPEQYLPARLFDKDTPAPPVKPQELSSLLSRILDASDTVIAPDLKRRLLQAHQHALEARTRFKTALQSALEVRAERAAADESWDEAYTVYHLTVEYVARSDPDRIRRWILPWPPG